VPDASARPGPGADRGPRGSIPLAALAALARELQATRGRLAKVEAAAGLLRRLTPEESLWAVAFLTGRPFPASDPRVLEVSGAGLRDVLDGLVASTEGERSAGGGPGSGAGSGSGADGPPLRLLEVAAAFTQVAEARGPGSRARKRAVLAGLLRRAGGDERDLLVRLLFGEMRLGLHEGLVPDAIAAAHGLDSALVRRALLFRSDPSRVAELAAREGAAGLHVVGVELMTPLAPMLADPAGGIAQALAAHGGRTALETKYDGARVQIHKVGDDVRIWSRRLTEVTDSLPDVVAIVRRDLRGASLILDGEVVAVAADGRPFPFQDLMRRLRRVHGIESSATSVPLRLHLFDCLYRDGASLVDLSYETRWAALAQVAPPERLAGRLVTGGEAEGEAFLDAALAAGHEGLIAKSLGSPYVPGTRGKRWLKIKRAETADCVIVAADRGSGRRRGWLSNYHLAVRDEDGTFAPVGKTFKGLTDQEFGAMTTRLSALATGDDGYTVTVRPEVVVEVAYNEIQRSPQYRSGLALRFARIVRLREDKAPADATPLATLRALYDRQFHTKARL
jgi:DNA ligase-1